MAPNYEEVYIAPYRVQPATVAVRKVAVAKSKSKEVQVVTPAMYDDLLRTFEEENARLRRILHDQKKFTDEVLEGNKKIRAEIVSLRRDLLHSDFNSIISTPGDLVRRAGRFVVASWEEIMYQCDRLEKWCDQYYVQLWLIVGIVQGAFFGYFFAKAVYSNHYYY